MPRQHEFQAISSPYRPGSRPVLKALLVAGSFALVIMAVAMIFMKHRFAALIEVGKNAPVAYAALNVEFPFQPPAPGDSTLGERWEAMAEVQRRMREAMDAETNQAIQGILGVEKLRAWDLAFKAMWLAEPLEAIAIEHVAALREHSMSLDEYGWMLGLAMDKVIDRPADDPAARGYREVLENLARLTRSRGDEGFHTREILDGLQFEYADYTQNRSGVTEALASDRSADYALDWIAVSGRWLDGRK
jgi:hypothetical protein